MDQTHDRFSSFLLVLLKENYYCNYFVLKFNISVPPFFAVQLAVVGSGFVTVVSTCSGSVTESTIHLFVVTNNSHPCS